MSRRVHREATRRAMPPATGLGIVTAADTEGFLAGSRGQSLQAGTGNEPDSDLLMWRGCVVVRQERLLRPGLDEGLDEDVRSTAEQLDAPDERRGERMDAARR